MNLCYLHMFNTMLVCPNRVVNALPSCTVSGFRTITSYWVTNFGRNLKNHANIQSTIREEQRARGK
jgi:hypothetical protein